jgi:deazaflavin-dependent oxidoreductase (nitroreductase family)
VNALTRAFNALGGSLMARSGRIGILGTTGAKTGKPRRAPLGYVARPDGTLLIGSGSPTNRGWTANLKADPAATFSVKGVERRYRARLVPPEDREAALAELRARMGSFAERADWGDLFVLEPEA